MNCSPTILFEARFSARYCSYCFRAHSSHFTTFAFSIKLHIVNSYFQLPHPANFELQLMLFALTVLSLNPISFQVLKLGMEGRSSWSCTRALARILTKVELDLMLYMSNNEPWRQIAVAACGLSCGGMACLVLFAPRTFV